MRAMLLFSIMLMVLKFIAFFITHSNAILTDALESIINIVAGGFALYSIHFASRPKDESHPYGHGKIEFLSAGFEGSLIFIAGGSIITKAVYGFFHPIEIHSLDIGLILSAIAGLCNYMMGTFLIKKGKRFNSILMIADGKHLISDTISSIGLVTGLLIITFTDLFWLDNVIAILFGAFIFYTGYRLVKESITGLLDKADYEKLEQLIQILNKNRRAKWIDIHNLRVLKYGSQLHVDCHITLPWYDSLEEAHAEIESVEKLVKENIEGDMEFFIHADPCLPVSCPICTISNCKVRKAPYVKTLEWTMKNLLPNQKHQL